MKLCFLTIMPSPYMRDFFAGLAADGEFELDVLYQEDAAPDTHWERTPLPDWSRVLPGRWFPFWGGRLHWNRKVTAALKESNADWYIVQGYAGITSQIAMRWLNRNRRPWIFWGERPGMRPLGSLPRLFRKWAIRPLHQGPAGIAAIGSQAVSAYREICSPEIPIANIPYHCDLDPFVETARRRVRDRNQFRVLYCGQLIERKGLRSLFAAFKAALREVPRLRLQLVGTGPLLEELKTRLSEDEHKQVDFSGFRSVGDLPRLFAQADLFVLPSLHDGWGVVVNQALGAGLPIVCSDAVGAGRDLVVDGSNGVIFPAGDTDQLKSAFLRLANDETLCDRMAENSRRMAPSWTVPAGVRRWKEFLSQLPSHRSTEPNPTS